MTPQAKKALVDQALLAEYCSCGGSHAKPDVLCFTGADAFDVLASDARSFLEGKQALVLDDENTHKAAGAAVAEGLNIAGIGHRVITLPGDTHLTDKIAADIERQTAGYALIIAAGSGTVNDLHR